MDICRHCSAGIRADGVSTVAGPEGPTQTAYAPDTGPGPVIIVISGQSGPNSYQSYAAELASLATTRSSSPARISLTLNLLARPFEKGNRSGQRSPHAVPGKTAVIGFLLAEAAHSTTQRPYRISFLWWWPITRTQVLGGQDGLVCQTLPSSGPGDGGAARRYMDCCVVESMQAMEAAAKQNGKQFQLVVYSEANHGFNLQTGAKGEPAGAYRRDDDREGTV